MKSHSLFLFVFLCLCTPVFAKTGAGGVSGKVVDEKSAALSYANVALLRANDSVMVKTELTNDNGEFQFSGITDGRYIVKVSLVGYDTYVSTPQAVAGANLPMPSITLKAVATQLGEATVRAQKPFVEVHADKIVVNVENSIVSSGGSALDVLSRSPGITVDQNDNITMKGKQGVNVMINGKIQPISAADLANMLKGMPSNAVESIELISNPSSKYDAAGTAGIINIKLKKDKKVGFNGSVNANYAQGVYGKISGGFNLNYRNKKFNVFANYNHSYREGFNHLTLQRNFYTNDVFSTAYNQDNNYVYKIGSDLGTLGVDYNLSSKTIIGAVVNVDATDFRRTGMNYTDVIDSVTRNVKARFTTANQSPNIWSSYAANANLRHTFDSSGKTLGVDLDYAYYPSRGTQDFATNYYDAAGARTNPYPYMLYGKLAGNTTIRSLKADYTNPLKNGAVIEAGIKSSYVTADNDLAFSTVDSLGNHIIDTGKTNHFIYNENINAVYVNISKDWPKWSTQIGLRAEQSVIEGYNQTLGSRFTRNYIQPFPSFAVQRHINKNNDLGITLSRRIARPNYEQLNPFKYYLDPTTYKAGYPYLNPALSYSAELSYVYKQKLITTISYSNTIRPITEVIQPSPDEYRVTIQTQKNLTSMDFYGVSGSYQFQFFKWWNNTTNFNAYYAFYRGDIANTNLAKGAATFDCNTTNSFILGKEWSAELGGFYQAPQVYGYMNVKETWMLNVGIQKNLLNKKLTLRLNATDIFWRGYPRATSVYNDYVESFVAKRDTRQVSVAVVYRFGKRTVPPAQRHSGGAEDEKNRVGGKAG